MSAHKRLGAAIQLHVQDWNNREFIYLVTQSMSKMTSFLNDFDMSCKNRLAMLNEKLTELERKIDYVEIRIHSCASAAARTAKSDQ